MDNNKIDAAKAVRGDAKKAKSITIEKLKDFLDQFGFSEDMVKCSVCGSHEFTIPIGPDSTDEVRRPLIITTPIPNTEGMGIWHFPIVCKKCTNTLMFNVGNIVKLIGED